MVLQGAHVRLRESAGVPATAGSGAAANVDSERLSGSTSLEVCRAIDHSEHNQARIWYEADAAGKVC